MLIEDYFDSAWYFDAGNGVLCVLCCGVCAHTYMTGEFYFPVSGFTHIDQTSGITWSAYRYNGVGMPLCLRAVI